MSRASNKIAAGLRDAVANAGLDKVVHQHFHEIAKAVDASEATWYELQATVWFGKRRHRITLRGGPVAD